MITENISFICYCTGFFTSTMLFLFLFPQFVMGKLFRVKIESASAELIARHWGMAVFITGVLLMIAGYDEAARKPILFCVGLNKLAFIYLMLFNYGKEYGRNFAANFLFDILCVVLFGFYLMGWA